MSSTIENTLVPSHHSPCSAPMLPHDDLDSLPSSSDTESTQDIDDEDEYPSDAEREWRESLQQLELLLTMVVVPYIGKYFGRKAAYWGWGRFMEWKFPVEVVVSDKGAFRAAGIVGAASAL